MSGDRFEQNNRDMFTLESNIPSLEGAISEDRATNKYDKIREIRARKTNNRVRHATAIRHGMTDEVAFEVESALIDLANKTIRNLTNAVTGHNSIEVGMMSADEIIRKYNAQPLERLHHSVVIININKRYKATREEALTPAKAHAGKDLIYESVKQAWVIGKRRESVDYVLAEFKGVIVGVYQVVPKVINGQSEKWYVPGMKNRWGFHGIPAPDDVRDLYLFKSMAHHKKRWTANPLRYRL